MLGCCFTVNERGRILDQHDREVLTTLEVDMRQEAESFGEGVTEDIEDKQWGWAEQDAVGAGRYGLYALALQRILEEEG